MSDSPPTDSRVARYLPGAVVLVLVVLIVVFMFRPKVRLGELTGEVMGTTYSVKIVTEGFTFGPSDQEALDKEIRNCLDDVDTRMSTYQARSELSRFNLQPADKPFQFSDETFHVMKRAMEVSELTGGAFDITVGPIVNAYGFGPETKPVEPPSDAKLADLKRRVGYRLVELDPATLTATKKRADVYCDLSAIAKGYGVDRAAALLDRRGIHRYMIEVGGEVSVHGLNAEGKPWRIAVEKPKDQGRAIYCTLGLTDLAIATTGDYHNYYMTNGVRICHEIDPRTGHAVQNDLASVSVIADDCETADAYATALMVLGPDQGYGWAERQGVATLFLVRQQGGDFLEKTTTAFNALVSGGRVQR